MKLPDTQGQRPTPRFGGGAAQVPELNAANRATSQLGQSIAGLGEVLAKKKVENDRFQVEDATTRLQQRSLDLSKGEDGFTRVKSGDVGDKFHSDYMGRFDAAKTDIENTLGNDEQKEMFSRRSAISRIGYGEGLINHVTRERDVFNGQVYTGGISSELDIASTEYDNENVVKSSILRTEKLTEAEADRRGLKGNIRKQLLKENKSNIHVSVIKQAVDDGNYQYAKDWFKKNQKSILGDQQDDVKRLLRKSGIKEGSQEAVDDYSARGLSESQARKEARKLDSELRDATLSRIESRYAEVSQDLDKDQKKNGEFAWSIYADTGIGDGSPEERLDAIPISVLDAMDGKDREALQNRAKQDAAGVKTASGGRDYYFLKLLARDNPNEFQKANALSYDLSDGDRKEIIKLQTNEKEQVISRNKTQIMKQGAIDAGVSKKEVKQGFGDDVLVYFKRFDEELAAMQESTGREPSKKDMSEIADRLSIEVIRDPGAWFFSGGRPAIEAKVDGVPPEMVDDLAMAIQKAGQPVTDENIRALYRYTQ